MNTPKTERKALVKACKGFRWYSIGSRQWQEACKIADLIAVKPDDKPLTNEETEALIIYLHGEKEITAP